MPYVGTIDCLLIIENILQEISEHLICSHGETVVTCAVLLRHPNVTVYVPHQEQGNNERTTKEYL